MNITQIETNLQNIVSAFNKDSFIYDVLLAYGQPKATITRLQQGSINLSNEIGELAWKKKLFFKILTPQDDLQSVFNQLKNPFPTASGFPASTVLRHDPRFIVVTDFETLLALDRKTADALDIPILDIAKHFDFFLPWAGMEKAQVQFENPADVKAAEKMGKLYAEIKKDNPTESPEDIHNLNIFLSRLLFCFFAEDTGIFDENIFTNSIKSHTQQDGSDLNSYLDKLFEVMNTPVVDTQAPAYLRGFPYVNGGLFKKQHTAPTFTRRSRDIVIECGELRWSDINPDIFGSMIQAVVSAEHRGGLGMHYTSVPNIMKVIEPLFLNDLKEEFETARGNLKKLNALLQRLWHIRIFDPACGSGNFLIIAYKELRQLEMLIFKEIDAVNQTYSAQMSGVVLHNFYGIELDDFAHEIAILSLWLAEHQMNQAFFKAFGRAKPALPLMETGNIVHGNATRLDWAKICPNTEGPVFVLGNPPYLGSSMQSVGQKEDMALVFKGIDGYKNLDYIACWFLKGANFIQNTNAQFAFVSTNSICQGEQVAMLWPHIFNKKLEIGFAYTSFKWKNNAKYNAGVSVIIVGLRNQTSKLLKFIFNEDKKIQSPNINSYLTNGQNIIIERRTESISKLPEMVSGNKAVYGEPLIITKEEKEDIIKSFPTAKGFIKKYLGNREFIDNIEKWVIWVNDNEVNEALCIKPIFDRVKRVKDLRLNSKDIGARNLAEKPHQFRDFKETTTNSIIIPQTGSEKRCYIPIGFCDKDTILSNACRVLYDSEVWLFSLLSSLIHITWVRAVAGRLKMDMQYSNTLCYNTFPMPPLSISQKKELEQHVSNILDERDMNVGKTLAELYDPDKMPAGLREAHHQNDLAVERIYRSKPFESDEERLAYLFKLYEQMIAAEKEAGTLFAAEKKGKKEKKK
jgi:type II restriction/modification system DNA methylase subunit YeeA